MAVINGYPLDSAEDKLQSAGFIQGTKVKKVVSEISIAAADDDTSVYRFVRGINPTAVVTAITVINATIAGATDYDIGIYETLDVGGAVKDKDAYADGLTLVTPHLRGSGLDGMSAVAIGSLQETVATKAGDTVATGKSYDIAFTANTAGTAAGTVEVVVEYIEQ